MTKAVGLEGEAPIRASVLVSSCAAPLRTCVPHSSSPPSTLRRAPMEADTVEWPPVLLRLIFCTLPVDARLRCGAVCSTWCAALDDATLWTALDLSSGAGLSRLPTFALLRAAVARAGAALTRLDISGGALVEGRAAVEGLCAVLATATSLRHLRVYAGDADVDWSFMLPLASVRLLAAALTALTTLECDCLANCSLSPDSQPLLRAMLRKETPFGALSPRGLAISDLNDNSTRAIAADVTAHASLRCVAFVDGQRAQKYCLDTLEALVDAALSLRLERFAVDLHLSAAAWEAPVARLVAGGALEALELHRVIRARDCEPSA